MFYTRKEEVTDDALALALLAGTGENPLATPNSTRATGASDTRSIESKPHARKLWFSSTVIHYTGNGLWTVGFAPHARSKNARWQWIHDLTGEQAQAVLGENRKCIVRCNTEEVRQILRDCP